MRSQVAAFRTPLLAPGSEPERGDLRFRALMSEADWAKLPLPIRRGFSKRLADGKTVVFVGKVTHAERGDGRFLFRFDIIHPRLGRLIWQTAAFAEAQP